MSRCFPFPPPGYEKKLRPDDTSLLIKEKHREKKHKKEKKDKEKKERKEEKEKRREKKEKKNKHKDKKEKERDKEKKRISEDQKVLGTSKHHNGGKLSPPSIQVNEPQPVLLLEQEKRLSSNNGTTETKMVGKHVTEGQGSVELRGKLMKSNFGVSSDGKEKLEDKRDNHKKVNGQTLKVVARGSEIGVSLKARGIAEDQGGAGFQGNITKSNFDVLSDGKEKLEQRGDNHRRVNGQTLKVVARGLEIRVCPKVRGEDEKKVEGGLFQVEKVNEKRTEQREKKKHKNRDGKGDKDRHRNQNKQTKSNEGKRGKEKEEENAIEEKNNLLIERSCISTADTHHGNGPSYISSETSRSKVTLGKRKEPETNGGSCDDDSRPSKLSRPISSSHHFMQNGSKHDLSRTAVQFALEKPVTVQNFKVHVEGSFPQSVTENGRTMNPSQIADGLMSSKKISVDNHKVQNSLSLSSPVLATGRKQETYKLAVNPTNIAPGVVSNHKLDNDVSSSQLDVKNELMSNGSQVADYATIERQGLLAAFKVNGKKHMINGLIKTEESEKVKEKITNSGTGVVSNHKLDNKVSLENKLMSNGSQVTNHTIAERQGFVVPLSVNGKKHVVNGLVKTEESKKTKEKIKTHKRPPHPDLKYLSQILTVPQVELPDSDDQEWLFSGSTSDTKKPRTISTRIVETEVVWAEALPIESADIVALPYVLPY